MQHSIQFMMRKEPHSHTTRSKKKKKRSLQVVKMHNTWPGDFLLGASLVSLRFSAGVCNRNRTKTIRTEEQYYWYIPNIGKNATSSESDRDP
jgi:hypothetical protein